MHSVFLPASSAEQKRADRTGTPRAQHCVLFKMRASKFEFEQRFWIIGIIISIGFFLYFADRANFAAGLLNLLAPTIDLDGPGGFFSCV
jgi:hypothetical protein